MPEPINVHRASRKRKSQMAQAMVRRLHRQGVDRYEIAKRTGYSYDNVCRIIAGSYLRHRAACAERDLAKSAALRNFTRHTAPADDWFVHANGCKSRVTGDTAGKAGAFLGLFRKMTGG